MTESLEGRIAALEDIAAIGRVKARYWRYLDRKQWAEFEALFADDARAHYRVTVEGRSAIAAHVRKSVEDQITMHHGHNGDIELTGATTARGVWAMHDRLFYPGTSTLRTGYGFYEDEFVKVAGVWKISEIRLIRLFPGRQSVEM